jgi:DNA recombination protein RmuC
MVKGEHFHAQVASQNEDGRAIRPDVVLQCPDGRRIVVDSKVSLTAYVRYCNDCNSPDEQKIAAREVYQSFKNHIDGLSAKKYETLRDSSSEVADFVLMFTPVEGAFTVASMHDAELRHYAFRKKVFLVTPGNLLLVVKLITDLWQKDAVNKRSHDMAERALKLYDKARLFLESFEAAGASISKAQSAWEEARTRLTGNGGLVRQGEMLGDLLGTKAKGLPSSLAAEADPLQDLLPEGTKLGE